MMADRGAFYHGSSVFLTGASTGIGRALVFGLLRQGANVFAVSRSEEKLKKLASEAVNMSSGGRLEVHVCDLSTRDSRVRAVEKFRQSHDGIDLLVNNAGIGHFSPFSVMSESDYEYVLATNLNAPIHLTHLLLESLGRGKRAAIINICSSGAFYGIAHRGVYCASKAAMRAWSQALTLEVARNGIRVFSVVPGATQTEFFTNQLGRAPKTHLIPGKVVLPGILAEKILRKAEGPSRELIFSIQSRFLLYCATLAPWLLQRLVRFSIRTEVSLFHSEEKTR
jgi:short-subunit dehydrogenase